MGWGHTTSIESKGSGDMKTAAIRIQHTKVEQLKQAMADVGSFVFTFHSPFSLERIVTFNTTADESTIRAIIAPFNALLQINKR
jgi:hypothetical protein